VNAAGNRHHDGDWEEIPLPVENIAVRGQPQDHVHNDMNYNMGHYPPLLPAVSGIYPLYATLFSSVT
jgi:hypothetical protein